MNDITPYYCTFCQYAIDKKTKYVGPCGQFPCIFCSKHPCWGVVCKTNYFKKEDETNEKNSDGKS